MNTEILCIIDKSGSMQRLRADVVGGFNGFVTAQRQVPGGARLTLVQFDTSYSLKYQARALREVPELSLEDYAPGGGTSLLDAIGKTMETQGKRIHAEEWAELVIVCIQTDGEENSSVQYKRPEVFAMIEHAQAHNWRFVYLGANQDSFKEASSIGINLAMAQAYGGVRNFAANAAGTQSSYADMSISTTQLRGGGK